MSYLVLFVAHLLLLGNSAFAEDLDASSASEVSVQEEGTLDTSVSDVQIGTSKSFGLGVLVGDPNGLSAKKYLGGRSHAVDMALAYRLWGAFGASYYGHGTYLIHPNEFVELDGVVLSWHTGVGGFLNLAFMDDGYGGTDTFVYTGARVPIGIDVDIEKLPVQMFVDVAVNIGLIPSTVLDAQGTLGFRYYFL